MADPGWYAELPLFVYGSLRPGAAAHAEVCGAVLRSEPAWVAGTLYDLPAQGFPALVAEGTGRVRGDLLWFDRVAAALVRLDAYEDCAPDGSGCYERCVVQAHPLRGGGGQPAWCYVWARRRRAWLAAHGVVVPGGDWLERSGATRPGPG
ncbi:MAG: gamma-glutamylcyclotransferase [Planctomycetota bacterium]|nr:MAG: gamma-glutamylcyclotransferase [Planctomycetota bacterium]